MVRAQAHPRSSHGSAAGSPCLAHEGCFGGGGLLDTTEHRMDCNRGAAPTADARWLTGRDCRAPNSPAAQRGCCPNSDTKPSKLVVWIRQIIPTRLIAQTTKIIGLVVREAPNEGLPEPLGQSAVDQPKPTVQPADWFRRNALQRGFQKLTNSPDAIGDIEGHSWRDPQA